MMIFWDNAAWHPESIFPKMLDEVEARALFRPVRFTHRQNRNKLVPQSWKPIISWNTTVCCSIRNYNFCCAEATDASANTNGNYRTLLLISTLLYSANGESMCICVGFVRWNSCGYLVLCFYAFMLICGFMSSLFCVICEQTFLNIG